MPVWLSVMLMGFLGVLAVLAGIVLLVPVEYWSQGCRNGSTRAEVGASWLFGALAVEGDWRDGRPTAAFRVLGGRTPLPLSGRKKPGKKERKGKKEKKTWYVGIRDADLGQFGNRAVFREAGLLIRRVAAVGTPREFCLEARVGFDDPSRTGWLCALYYPGEEWLREKGISLDPCFARACLEGSYRIRGRIVLAPCLLALLRFGLSRPVRNAWRERRRRKKKQSGI